MCDLGSVTANANRHTDLQGALPSQGICELQGRKQPLGQALSEGVLDTPVREGNSPAFQAGWEDALERKGGKLLENQCRVI